MNGISMLFGLYKSTSFDAVTMLFFRIICINKKKAVPLQSFISIQTLM